VALTKHVPALSYTNFSFVHLKCGEMRSANRVSVGKPEGRTQLGRTSVDVKIILN
jgi:hypothetical protein